ncbi:hypothetical protein [Desulfurobacterium indicum]|uniref:GspL periplasmic domain-containing protein n=1 Tax=Desulfurobacterium indicum TaxID=1914305 RepID=A0A1R1MM84_9BACT|nr:hypothetical protein [Desulfurobacterium indicum]OMH40863.1 hypothetical protein BLW93_02815 [Desulfurobacterium indicum]
MIVRVEYPDGYGESFEVNVLKGEIKPYGGDNYDRLFILLPAEKTTFRIKTFPFSDKRKIYKIIEGEIKSNPILSGRDLVFRSLFFPMDKGTAVFTVITGKEDIERIGKQGIDVIDSEVVSLLRIVLLSGKNGDFYYEKENGNIIISVRDGIPISVKVGEKEKIGEPIRLEAMNKKILPLFGSALQIIRNTEVNFLKEESSDTEISLVKSALFLLFSLVVLSGALFAGGVFFKRKIRGVRNKEAELFEKKFPDIPAVDPLTQLKGMLHSASKVEIDTVDVMDEIGKVKNGISVLKFNAGDGRFSVEGEAPDISSVTSFAGRLKKFNAEITETVTLKDKVRFRLEGRY